jgi:hypothetical protein
MTMMKQH